MLRVVSTNTGGGESRVCRAVSRNAGADGGAHLSEKRRPVDLIMQLVRLQLLDRASQRAKRRNVGADALSIEAPDPAVLRHQPGSARRGRIEVVLEIQV
jgi:hypothetical protein